MHSRTRAFGLICALGTACTVGCSSGDELPAASGWDAGADSATVTDGGLLLDIGDALGSDMAVAPNDMTVAGSDIGTPGLDGASINEDSQINDVDLGSAADALVPAPDAGSLVVKDVDLVFSSNIELCDAVSCPTISYDINVLRELHIYGLWKDVTGEHFELRKIYSPDGKLYEEKIVPFTTVAEDEGKEFTSSAGLPFVRNYQYAKLNADGQRTVWYWFAVGGSQVTERHLVGSWRVEIFLDRYGGTADVVKSFTLAD